MLTVAAAVWPGAAAAHDAFGDLGPFYASLLHPLADPAQAVLLAATAILLARQPIGSVRPAYAALAAGGLLLAGLHVALPVPAPALQVMGLVAALLAGVALPGRRLPVPVLCLAVVLAAGIAALALDRPDDARAAMLSVFGGAAGIALVVLLLWGALDLLQARLGRVAGAVAASWAAATGLMTAALPA